MSAQRPSTKRYAALAADEYGTGGDQPPIVLLHGISFDRTMWRPALDELRAIDPDRRALAFDLPGHGDSPDATSYSFEAVLNAVRSAIVEAGLEAPVMVGHSAAAGTAAMYASRYPTSGVVVVDGSFLVGDFAALVQSMRGALEGPGFADVWARITGGVFGLDDVAPDVRAFVSETSRPRAEVVRGYWAELLDRDPDELQLWVDAAADAIHASGVPVAAVIGRKPSAREATWLAAHIPAARSVVWPRSGHFPHLAHPRSFAALLSETAAWKQPDHAVSVRR